MASQLEVPSRLVLALKRRKVKIPKHRKPGNRRSVLRKMEESMEESMKESIKESSRRKLASHSAAARGKDHPQRGRDLDRHV